MAFKLADRARETSTAPGTGAFALNGAVPGAQSFASFLSVGDTTLYAANNGTAWENGIGKYTGANTLSRLRVLSSSNAGNPVNFSSGLVDIACDIPASLLTGAPLVILATGQSNFVLQKTLAWSPAPNVRLWNWDGTTGHVGTDFTTLDPTNVNSAWKAASDIALANPNRMVYLVDISITGQAISHWLTGTGSPDLYTDVVNNITPALTAIGASKIDMFLWWQGNGDGADSTLEGKYLANFETMLNRFKALSWYKPWTPVGIVGLGASADTGFAYMDRFNDILRAVVDVDPDNRKFIDPAAFSGSGFWDGSNPGHMVAAGYDAVGSEIARVMTSGSNRGKVAAAALDSLAYDGMQVNGHHAVSQIAVDNAITLTSGGIRLTDMWTGFCNGPVATGQRVASPFPTAPGIPFGLKVNITTAKAVLSAGDYLSITTKIEGRRTARLAMGNSLARHSSVGFWVRSSIAFVGYLVMRNGAADRTYMRRYSVAANTDTWIDLKFPGCFDGTWITDTGTGVSFTFELALGSNFNAGTADQWNTSSTQLAASDQTNLGATLGNNIIFSDFIFVPGLQLPPADHVPLVMRPFDETLQLCQRHIEKSYDELVAPGTASSLFGLESFVVPSNTVAAGQQYGFIRFKSKKAINSYTATVYGYGGATGVVSNAAPTDLAANSGFIGTKSMGGFTFSNQTGGAITTTGNIVTAHWAVDTGL